MTEGGRHTHAPDRRLDQLHQLRLRARPEPGGRGSPGVALKVGRSGIAASADPGSSRPNCHETFAKICHDLLEIIRKGINDSGLDTYEETAADRLGNRIGPVAEPAWFRAGLGHCFAPGAAAVGFDHLAILSHWRSRRLHQLNPRPVRTAGIVASRILQSRASDLLRTYSTSVATRRR